MPFTSVSAMSLLFAVIVILVNPEFSAEDLHFSTPVLFFSMASREGGTISTATSLHSGIGTGYKKQTDLGRCQHNMNKEIEK